MADATDKQRMLLEAHRRGLLSSDKSAMVEQAMQRGLFEGVEYQQPTPVPVEAVTEAPMPSQAPSQATQQPELGIGNQFVQNVTEARAEREREVVKSMEDYAKGEINLAEAGVQIVGKGGAGTALDIAGAGIEAGLTAREETGVLPLPISLGLKGIDFIVPEDMQQDVADSFKEGIKWVVNTDAGNAAASMFEGGFKEYTDWAKDNPQDAKTFESVVNIATLLPSAIAKPVKATLDISGNVLKKGGKFLTSRGRGKAHALKSKVVSELMIPDQTPAQLLKQVSRTRQSGGLLGRTNVVTPSAMERTAAREVMLVPGIKGDRSLVYNKDMINNTNLKLAKKLEAQLAAASKTTKVPHTSVADPMTGRPAGVSSIGNLQDDMAKMLDESTTLVGESAKTVARVTEETAKIIQKHPQTPLGLLNARKEFDAFATLQKKGVLNNDAQYSALTEAIRTARSSINRTIEASVPTTKVGTLLSKQSKLYDALDILEPKAAKEAKGVIGRLWQNVTKVTAMKAEMNRELAVMMGLGVTSAAATIAPVAAAGAASIGLGIAAWKGLTGSHTDKALGMLLKQTGKAIKH